MESYEPGKSQPSFDKQPLRDWLESLDWDKTPPPPTLPEEVIKNTAQRYYKALELLTGESF
jgi:phosphoribosylaminoimidazole-succinocarboxamide synthase